MGAKNDDGAGTELHGWPELLRASAILALALVLAACVRLGFGVPGDDSNRRSDAARSGGIQDGSSDGPRDDSHAARAEAAVGDVSLDGPQSGSDHRVVDGPPDPDNSVADQQTADAPAPNCAGDWCTIPGGTFSMGSPTTESCRATDETQHQVVLTHSYEMQRSEVTQAQFSTLMGYNPVTGTSCGINCPVVVVSWHEMAAYCNALSQSNGKTSCYTCSGSGAAVSCQKATAYVGAAIYTCPGYRLPTEAEWEHAYRASTTTAYYNGTNNPGLCTNCSTIDANLGLIGWYCANAGSAMHPVMQKQANRWGLYDMAGNVGEWCEDEYTSDLGSAAVQNPFTASGTVAGYGHANVVRGGDWFFLGAQPERAAARSYRKATDTNGSIGGRCVRTLP